MEWMNPKPQNESTFMEENSEEEDPEEEDIIFWAECMTQDSITSAKLRNAATPWSPCAPFVVVINRNTI
ncbi:hypothetical protein Lal_00049808 [Lupinus albus]|nr:hypothetical protein Lal_00049808 [Lupinus albus]